MPDDDDRNDFVENFKDECRALGIDPAEALHDALNQHQFRWMNYTAAYVAEGDNAAGLN